jgi:hypothetical protein
MGTSSTVMQTSWSALKRKDLRHSRRYALDAGVLKISWLDVTGSMKMARTRGLNISEGGIAIELPEAALPLSLVRFQSDRFNVRGAGYVRHCRRAGSKFIVGLEFAEGLRWCPPEGEPTEPISLCDPEADYLRGQ